MKQFYCKARVRVTLYSLVVDIEIIVLGLGSVFKTIYFQSKGYVCMKFYGGDIKNRVFALAFAFTTTFDLDSNLSRYNSHHALQ